MPRCTYLETEGACRRQIRVSDSFTVGQVGSQLHLLGNSVSTVHAQALKSDTLEYSFLITVLARGDLSQREKHFLRSSYLCA